MEEKIIRMFEDKLERLRDGEFASRIHETEEINHLLDYWRDIIVSGLTEREKLLKDMLSEKETNLNIVNDRYKALEVEIEQLDRENIELKKHIEMQKLIVEKEKLLLESSYKDKYEEKTRKMEKEFLGKYIDLEKLKLEKEELNIRLEEKKNQLRLRENELENYNQNTEMVLRKKQQYIEEIEKTNKDLERTIELISKMKMNAWVSGEKTKEEITEREETEMVIAGASNQKITELEEKLNERDKVKDKEKEELINNLESQKNKAIHDYKEKSKNELAEKIAESEKNSRKKIVEVLKRREESYSKSLEVLSRGFVHKMRNIFGIIGGAAQLCQAELEPYKEDVKELIKKLKEKEGSQMINELLENFDAISKHIDEAGKAADVLLEIAKVPAISMQVGSLNAVLDEVCFGADDRCKAAGVSVTKEFDENIPDIVMDKKLIEDAFYQIVINAVEAMSNGGALTVNSELHEDGKNIIVKIIDTGEGIPEQRLSKVFQIFCTSKKERYGIGLPQAERYIETHLGTIGLESEKGAGTTVSVVLPVVKE